MKTENFKSKKWGRKFLLSFFGFQFSVLLFTCLPTEAAVIKAGMTLNIAVKNDKDLSMMVRVNDNGTIDYPLYQDAPVTGKTTSELQDILTFKLAKVVESPLVLVSVVTETPISVYVLGQVKKPGIVQASPKASLQEVLLQAQGTTETADLQRVKLVRKNARTRATRTPASTTCRSSSPAATSPSSPPWRTATASSCSPPRRAGS
jgi:protein involved in polysaccharide export with SLBB domain